MPKIPTRKQCLKLLEEHKVPDNVRKHSFAVNKVAVFLAKKLKEKGIKIDVELVDRASLLHDLDKIQTLGKGNHGEQTRKILSEKGFDKVGETARRHLMHHLFEEGITWEDRIINYADKRCNDNRIVPLKERFAYIRKRYKRDNDAVYLKGEKVVEEIEKEIFNIIKLDPEKLGEYIESS